LADRKVYVAERDSLFLILSVRISRSFELRTTIFRFRRGPGEILVFEAVIL